MRIARGDWLLIALAAVAVVASAIGTHREASAGKPCARKKFETTLVRDACQKGGQDEAKKVMKKFLAEAKKKNASLGCGSCHSKVAADYPLKQAGLKTFKNAGGN